MSQITFLDSSEKATARRIDAISDGEYTAAYRQVFAHDAFRLRQRLFRADGKRKPLWRDQLVLHLNRQELAGR